MPIENTAATVKPTEAKQGEEAVLIAFDPFDVTRNGVTLNFTKAEVERGAKKKGSLYPFSDVNETTWPNISGFMGPKVLVAKVGAFFAQKCQSLWFNAVDTATSKEDGKCNVTRAIELFSKWMEEFSAWGESTAKLNEREQGLVKQLAAFTDEFAAYAERGIEGINDFKAKMKSLADEIKSIQQEKEERKRSAKAEVEDDEDTTPANAPA